MNSQNENLAMHGYVAKQPDAQGYIDYSDEEHAIWKILYERQLPLVKERACDAFFTGVKTLALSHEHVPQCREVSNALRIATGWSIVPVPALISFETFFSLLASKSFPAASFIRRREDLDYLKEPDIFHEVFGHCPLLTQPEFAAFTHEIGKFGLTLSQADRVMLGRLYWFTVEFGLIKTQQGLRIYGAGILSSKAETIYALESAIPQRKLFDLLEVLRTPYRYDEIQKVYFVIDSFSALYDMIKGDLLSVFAEAKKLGMLPDLHAAELTDMRSC